MIQSHQSESLCLRVCDGWVGKSKKKKKKERRFLDLQWRSEAQMKSKRIRSSNGGRGGTNVVVKQQQTQKKENSSPIPIKIGFFSCSISIHWKCVKDHIWVYRSITTPKKKSLSLQSLCLQSRYCALVLSQQSHSRGKVFFFLIIKVTPRLAKK